MDFNGNSENYISNIVPTKHIFSIQGKCFIMMSTVLLSKLFLVFQKNKGLPFLENDKLVGHRTEPFPIKCQKMDTEWSVIQNQLDAFLLKQWYELKKLNRM